MPSRIGLRPWLKTYSRLLVFVALVLIGYAVLALSMMNLERGAQLRIVALDMRHLLKAVTRYAERAGHVPPPSVGLSALVEERLLERIPVDPWGHDYVYRVEEGTPVILSYGRDGIPDGEGPDADHSSRVLLVE
ncbi:type II secretion system protein GspG [Corallococcus exiguus]|uniref:type II secretion system protein GspG n=1 Tax=Corallococcus exiguus TaxID=83462 RepID=UPI00147319ED|nr:type II secretion system protein GspG [Corallococcus exiguus]NNB96068.1 type II secretion system protein GspG [Corallococcus exiguus]